MMELTVILPKRFYYGARGMHYRRHIEVYQCQKERAGAWPMAVPRHG